MDRTLRELGIKLDRVINISVPEPELMDRMTGRLICRKCGATYHKVYNPPHHNQICDQCGGELYQRDDDREETVKNRLTVYAEQTQPLIEYYHDQGLYSEIDGQQDIHKVFEDIIACLRGDYE